MDVLTLSFSFIDSPVHNIGDKTTSSWSDEQLTVYDCHDRLRGYHYVGVIDLDEFLVPRRGNIQELLVNIRAQLFEINDVVS